MTLQQIENLLDEQKRLVVERLRGQSYYYNKESTDGSLKTLPIDEQRFLEVGMAAKYPDDVNVLRRYVK